MYQVSKMVGLGLIKILAGLVLDLEPSKGMRWIACGYTGGRFFFRMFAANCGYHVSGAVVSD